MYIFYELFIHSLHLKKTVTTFIIFILVQNIILKNCIQFSLAKSYCVKIKKIVFEYVMIMKYLSYTTYI